MTLVSLGRQRERERKKRRKERKEKKDDFRFRTDAARQIIIINDGSIFLSSHNSRVCHRSFSPLFFFFFFLVYLIVVVCYEYYCYTKDVLCLCVALSIKNRNRYECVCLNVKTWNWERQCQVRVMCSPFSYDVFVCCHFFPLFFAFLFAVVEVRLQHGGWQKTVCTRKITIIARNLYVDDVADWLVDCQVLRIGKSEGERETERKRIGIESLVDDRRATCIDENFSRRLKQEEKWGDEKCASHRAINTHTHTQLLCCLFADSSAVFTHAEEHDAHVSL